MLLNLNELRTFDERCEERDGHCLAAPGRKTETDALELVAQTLAAILRLGAVGRRRVRC